MFLQSNEMKPVSVTAYTKSKENLLALIICSFRDCSQCAH